MNSLFNYALDSLHMNFVKYLIVGRMRVK